MEFYSAIKLRPKVWQSCIIAQYQSQWDLFLFGFQHCFFFLPEDLCIYIGASDRGCVCANTQVSVTLYGVCAKEDGGRISQMIGCQSVLPDIWHSPASPYHYCPSALCNSVEL